MALSLPPRRRFDKLAGTFLGFVALVFIRRYLKVLRPEDMSY